MAELPNNQLKWVGCLFVLGLTGALGFVGYRVWDRVSHVPASVSTLPSARVGPPPLAPVAPSRQVAPVPAPSGETTPVPAPTLSLPSARPELASLDVSGKLAPDIVRRILRQNFGRLRLCNEKAVPDQRMPAGIVTLRFVIGPDGSVAQATVTNDGPAARGVAECIVQAIENLNFPRPSQGVVAVNAAVAWQY
jgi:hypothetical protein